MKSVQNTDNLAAQSLNSTAPEQQVSSLPIEAMDTRSSFIQEAQHFRKDPDRQPGKSSMEERLIRRTKDGRVKKQKDSRPISKGASEAIKAVYASQKISATGKVKNELFSILESLPGWKMVKFTSQDIKRVKELLGQVNINMHTLFMRTNKYGLTIMMVAVIKRDINMVRALLEGISSDEAQGRKIIIKVVNQLFKTNFQSFYKDKVGHGLYDDPQKYYGTKEIEVLFKKYTGKHHLVWSGLGREYIFREDMPLPVTMGEVLPEVDASSGMTWETVEKGIKDARVNKVLGGFGKALETDISKSEFLPDDMAGITLSQK